MNILENEPVIEPRYVPEHDSLFDKRAKNHLKGREFDTNPTKNGHSRPRREIPVIRATLANVQEDNEDLLTKSNNAKDLRSLIEQMKLQQSCDDTETRSDDSFYSTEEIGPLPKEASLSYVRDLINALGSSNSTASKRQEIMGILSGLDLNVKLAEPLTCSGYDDRLDIFQVCSILLVENKPPSVLLANYLKFFGKVLQVTFEQSDIPYGIKKLIHKRVDEFELYQRLVEILDDCEDEEFLNVVAKVVYFSTSKAKVADLNRAQEFSLKRFIKELREKKVKYLSKLSIKYIRYLYEIRHEQLNVSNEAYMDLEYCDWLVHSLQRYRKEQEDCLYGLYYIMNKMPISNVKAVFDANKLKDVLLKVKESFRHQTHVQTELELVIEKILFFPQNGNFLTEKLQRSAVLDLNRCQGKFPNKKSANNYLQSATKNYGPLNNPAKMPTYRGVLRSITELKNPIEDFAAHGDIQAFKDRRLDLILEEERKVTKFIFGAIFSKQTIIAKGFNVALVPDTNHKYLVAHHVCDLLNDDTKHGILILGIAEKDEARGIIEGIHMTRKDRDEFRIGLDNLLRDLVVPMPPYHRFDSPIFNPVVRHPNSNLTSREGSEHYVIRLDVKKPQTDKEIIYQVKRRAVTSTTLRQQN